MLAPCALDFVLDLDYIINTQVERANERTEGENAMGRPKKNQGVAQVATASVAVEEPVVQAQESAVSSEEKPKRVYKPREKVELPAEVTARFSELRGLKNAASTLQDALLDSSRMARENGREDAFAELATQAEVIFGEIDAMFEPLNKAVQVIKKQAAIVAAQAELEEAKRKLDLL